MKETKNNEENINLKIDIKNQKFPYCIVWTPLPLMSWFIPLIGHTGICSYDYIYKYKN